MTLRKTEPEQKLEEWQSVGNHGPTPRDCSHRGIIRWRGHILICETCGLIAETPTTWHANIRDQYAIQNPISVKYE